MFSGGRERMCPATLIKKKTLAQVFSSEFCEISKNTFSYRTPPVAASVSAGLIFTPEVFTRCKKVWGPRGPGAVNF